MTIHRVTRLTGNTIGLYIFSAAALWMIYASSVVAQEQPSILFEQDRPRNVYWGDTHLHTRVSTDSYAIGNRLGYGEAYRLARGDKVLSQNNRQVQLYKPLDFLVIADHAENLGVAENLVSGNAQLLETEATRHWKGLLERVKTDSEKVASLIIKLHLFLKEEIANIAFRKSQWHEAIRQAEYYNDPGTFTTFIGFEWSSRDPYYIHRVVIFKDNADKLNEILPYSSHQGNDPEQLWQYFEEYQRETGGEVLAIPHTANRSDGKMFMLTDFGGRPFSVDYARNRQRWEPLFEVTQTKGTSEANPRLSPDDEFADFEIRDSYEEGGSQQGPSAEYLGKKRFEYARPALKLGLQEQARLGVNPFKFGLVGGTDFHNSLAGAEESNFLGWLGMHEFEQRWVLGASGYSGVWASENTRESLFEAMKRKEVYASTGPRIEVRFFGGWDYEKKDAMSPDLAAIGYSKGVPMGGDLTHAPENISPSFLIRAVRDPDGANLERVQLIKGWRSADGELHEKVYNVALSDGRNIGTSDDILPLPTTVNIEDASYTNTAGDHEFSVVWQDPDFNRDELAFYYIRVLEISTPRWSTYKAQSSSGISLPKDVPAIIQERAYTSPIWYSPATKSGRE